MQSVSELVTSAMKCSRIAKERKQLSEAELMEMYQRKADRYNAERGSLNDYDCPICLNRGNSMKIIKDEQWGMIREGIVECKCMKVRRSIWRMRQSGLEMNIKRLRFETYEAKEPWQEDMLRVAKGYAQEPKGWLFFGGQVGSGKTHLCTAVCRELLLKGHEVYYMPWQTEVSELKQHAMDSDVYADKMSRLKSVEVLYIDDFFKPVQGQEPSAADVRIAYDIINYRYCNQMPTLISSERNIMELVGIDEATGSRIYEMSKAHNMSIRRDPTRDYRIKGASEE